MMTAVSYFHPTLNLLFNNCVKYVVIRLVIRESIFACLFSVHNTISLTRHEQALMLVL